MSDKVMSINNGNLFIRNIFEHNLKYNPVFYLDFISGTKTPIIYPVYLDNSEYSGNSYPFFQRTFYINSLRKIYGDLFNNPNDKIYIHFVGLTKIDQQQKDTGQSSLVYIFHRSSGDGWTLPTKNIFVNNTQYTYFHISQYIAEWFTDQSDGLPNDRVTVQCYHYPSSNRNGLAYLKNIAVYLSKDPNFQLPVYIEPEKEEGILKTFKGIQILPSLNNIIGNGQFQDGKHIENMYGSYGVYKVSLHQDNPLQDISPYVLEQYSGQNGEYEIHPRSGESLQNTTYKMYIWHKQDPTFDGNTQIMHSRWWYDDGTNAITTGTGTTIQKYKGYELRRTTFTPDSNKTLTGSYSWYIGFPTGGTNQNAKRYLTGQMVVQHPYDIDILTYFEGVKPKQDLEYKMELYDNFTIYFRMINVSRYNRNDKTYIGMQNQDKTQYINIFSGWGNDFYVGNHTNRTENRISDFVYSNTDTLDFFITKQGSSLRIKIYKNRIQYYDQTVNNSDFQFDIYYVRIGRGYGNQDIESTIQKQIYQKFQQFKTVLSDSNMDDIVKGNFTLKKEVFDINIKEVSYILEDQFYNPLNSEFYDGSLKPINSTNQIITKDGTFVGLDKINLQGNFSNWSVQRPNRKYIKTPYGYGFEYKSGQLSSTWSGNSYGYIYKDISTTNGTQYVFQSWCYASPDCDIDFLPLRHEGQIDSQTDVYYDMTKKGTWQLLMSKPVATKDGNARFLVYPSKNGVDDGSFNGYFIITQPIIVQSNYFTEFGGIYTSISKSYLQFNLYESIGLKWNQPYTILLWQKPCGTHTNNLNGYSIMSFGCNSNSVGGKYLWFGKENNSNTFRIGGIGGTNYIYGISLDPNKWFNNWIFTQITSNGTNITIRFYNRTKLFDHTVTYSSIPENGFVTQYGYDFCINGWDNTNTCPKVVRDLIVLKQELSLQEIEEIYYNHLRIGDIQKIQNEMFEIL